MSNEQYKSEYVRWIDILKGLGIIFVVIGHVYSNEVIYNWIYSFHMPLFFFASGYVYKKRSVLLDFKHRVKSIIVPYFIFGFLEFIYWVVLERRFRDSKLSISESFVGLFLGQYDYLEFNVHLWFLPCFFVTVLIYNILMNINKIAAYMVVFLMSFMYLIIPLPSMFWGTDRVFKYIFFYLIGNILARCKLEKLVTGIGVIGAWILGCVLIITNFFFSYYGYTKGFMWFITGIIGVMGIAVISIRINRNKTLQYLGRISLIVLCIHGPLYRVLLKVLSFAIKLNTDEIRERFVLVMIVVAITLYVTVLVYKVLILIAPWMIGKKKIHQ